MDENKAPTLRKNYLGYSGKIIGSYLEKKNGIFHSNHPPLDITHTILIYLHSLKDTFQNNWRCTYKGGVYIKRNLP